MRVLLIADAGDGFLDVAIRSQSLGHDTKTFCRRYDRWKRPIGRGLIELVPDFHPWLRWADLILLEGNSVYMLEADRWRSEGMAVIGGGVESARWESDRAYGMQILKKCGIPIAPYREFTNYDEAMAYVKRRGVPFASKPSGHCDDKALSYVAKSAEDLLYMLGRWKRSGKRAGVEFILQEKIKGVEFAVGGWFGPAGFASGWEENFEHKKLMPGDLGPNTGELGTVMRFVRRSKLAERVLVPLEEELARIGYIGNVDVNCIVDEDGTPWPLEFTMRFGWPAFNIELALHSGDFIDFLSCIATGQPIPRSARALNRIACGVVLAIPDFPYSHATRKEVIGLPLYGLDEKIADSWHPCEMMKGEETEMCSAGDYIGVATGAGDTVREAARGAYRVLDKLSMPASPFWRIDIGTRLRKQLPQLQEHGFAEGMEY
jgi:phosphoribosylamine---glycine ligase